MKLVFASHNQNKVQEIASLLPQEIELLSLTDIAFYDEIPETELTLEGNSRLKAKTIYSKTGMYCFADDTGLEVEALDGRPGVFSARYASSGHDFEANIDKVLSELNGVSNRKARFRTVIALHLDGSVYYFEGIVNGKIIHTRKGIKGFGYDPVFLPDGYELTFAEMPLSEKNKISHRARAVGKLVDFLKSGL